MYCPSCGSDIAVELKYCNRCGANLTVPMSSPVTMVPVKLTVPSIVLGLTIIGGLGIIFSAAAQFAFLHLHPAAITWMVIFASATLFGCVALMIRFWTKLLTLQKETLQQVPVKASFNERVHIPQLPPRMEPVPSVTENTTRTFSPIFSDPDRGTK